MEKLKVIQITAFVHETVKRPDPLNNISTTGSVEIFLPIDAISHLTKETPGNLRSGYLVHIKKDYPLNLPFLIKSFNAPKITDDQVELLNKNGQF